jgi:CheY-like chemotaxis protein
LNQRGKGRCQEPFRGAWRLLSSKNTRILPHCHCTSPLGLHTIRIGARSPMTVATRSSDSSPLQSVLIACADPDLCLYFTNTLTSKGYDVECVSDGKTCFERIQKNPFSAVILNHRLPILDCPLLITEIRTIQPTLPIIFSTVVGALPIAHRQSTVAVLRLPCLRDELYESLQQAIFLTTTFGSNRTAPKSKA